MGIEYLTSYEHMGTSVVSCESGCSCASKAIDALQMAQPASAGGAATSSSGEALTRNVSIATIAELPAEVAEREAAVVVGGRRRGENCEHREGGRAELGTRREEAPPSFWSAGRSPS